MHEWARETDRSTESKRENKHILLSVLYIHRHVCLLYVYQFPSHMYIVTRVMLFSFRYVCTYVCVYVYMYVCKKICMYVRKPIYIYIGTWVYGGGC